MPSPTRSGADGHQVRLARWLRAPLVVALLAGSWILTYAAGGTQWALPHLFYVPIVLAALMFGVWGGLAAAIAAMLLCGPAMPVDVAAGEGQQLLNWLARGGFFAIVAVLVGTSTTSLHRRFRAGLTRQLAAELEPPDEVAADPAWVPRILQVIERHAFHPVFQPIYSLGDGRLIAVEALTRFDTDPPHPPDDWFSQAERSGLGIELELSTLQAAFDASRDLSADVALSFNASPALLSDPRLLQLLDWHRDRTLITEITEHSIVDDYPLLQDALAPLRARGIRLAVDDAGAGFASLRHIVRLQPEFIKLDLSLTQNLDNDPIRRPLADCLIQFANRTSSAIIVEGIERAEDLATWRNLGAHAAQGYLLGRPAPLPTARHTNALELLTTSPSRRTLSHTPEDRMDPTGHMPVRS